MAKDFFKDMFSRLAAGSKTERLPGVPFTYQLKKSWADQGKKIWDPITTNKTQKILAHILDQWKNTPLHYTVDRKDLERSMFFLVDFLRDLKVSDGLGLEFRHSMGALRDISYAAIDQGDQVLEEKARNKIFSILVERNFPSLSNDYLSSGKDLSQTLDIFSYDDHRKERINFHRSLLSESLSWVASASTEGACEIAHDVCKNALKVGLKDIADKALRTMAATFSQKRAAQTPERYESLVNLADLAGENGHSEMQNEALTLAAGCLDRMMENGYLEDNLKHCSSLWHKIPEGNPLKEDVLNKLFHDIDSFEAENYEDTLDKLEAFMTVADLTQSPEMFEKAVKAARGCAPLIQQQILDDVDHMAKNKGLFPEPPAPSSAPDDLSGGPI
jgi:hypothetical protein